MPLVAPDSSILAAVPSAQPLRSADTMTNGVQETMIPGKSGAWQFRVYSALYQVEALLDDLECHGVREREVLTAGPSSFIVRWR